MSRKFTIYAVDFDGTLCESQWPGIGAPNIGLIYHLKKRQKEGNKIILWTCREGERLQEAVEWCRELGLEFDAVNDNIPELIEQYGCNSRKVCADAYIDDHSVLKEIYNIPYHLNCDELIDTAEKIIKETSEAENGRNDSTPVI